MKLQQQKLYTALLMHVKWFIKDGFLVFYRNNWIKHRNKWQISQNSIKLIRFNIFWWFFTDTEQLYLKVFNNLLEPYNEEFTWEDNAATMGYHTNQIESYLLKKFDLPITQDQLHKRLMEDYAAIFPTCQLLPGMFSKIIIIILIFKLFNCMIRCKT